MMTLNQIKAYLDRELHLLQRIPKADRDSYPEWTAFTAAAEILAEVQDPGRFVEWLQQDLHRLGGLGEEAHQSSDIAERERKKELSEWYLTIVETVKAR